MRQFAYMLAKTWYLFNITAALFRVLYNEVGETLFKDEDKRKLIMIKEKQLFQFCTIDGRLECFQTKEKYFNAIEK